MISWDANLGLIRWGSTWPLLLSPRSVLMGLEFRTRQGEDRWGDSKATGVCAGACVPGEGHPLDHLTQASI